VEQIEQNGATSGAGLLAAYAYDDYGNRTHIARAGGPGADTAMNYDHADRIHALNQNLAGTTNDVSTVSSHAYMPSPLMVGQTTTNDANSYHQGVVDRGYVANGLNQYSTVGGASYSYDALGNLLNDGAGGDVYAYDPGNRLLTATPKNLPTVTLTYDPLDRLQTSTTSGALDLWCPPMDEAGNRRWTSRTGSTTLQGKWAPRSGTIDESGRPGAYSGLGPLRTVDKPQPGVRGARPRGGGLLRPSGDFHRSLLRQAKLGQDFTRVRIDDARVPGSALARPFARQCFERGLRHRPGLVQRPGRGDVLDSRIAHPMSEKLQAIGCRVLHGRLPIHAIERAGAPGPSFRRREISFFLIRQEQTPVRSVISRRLTG
jgi:hypothetical protein